MTWVALVSAALAVGGLPGVMAVLGLLVLRRVGHRRRRPAPPPIRILLLVLLVEVRLGRSVLAGLQFAAAGLPEWQQLGRAARLATLKGLTAAVSTAEGELSTVLSQLARAQRSGAPLADSIRAMIEADIAAERARHLARARSLPVRLMVPMTLLVLPGLVLLLYAPALLRLLEDMVVLP